MKQMKKMVESCLICRQWAPFGGGGSPGLAVLSWVDDKVRLIQLHSDGRGGVN